MKVTLVHPKAQTFIVSAQVEGGDNTEMHDNFAKCIALFRGLDNKIVVENVDLVKPEDRIAITFTCPYDYTKVKDRLNKYFTEHGFGVE